VIATHVQRGREAWPQLDISEEGFASYLAERGVAEPSAHSADLYLACGCALAIPAALVAFEANFLSRVPEWVRRVDSSPEFASEVSSVLREKLLVALAGRSAKISEYSGRGPLGGWLRMVAVRTAIDFSRSRLRQKEVQLENVVVSPDGDPELEYLKHAYQPQFKAAFDDSLRALTSEQRSLLRLHFVDGLSFDEMSSVLGTSKSTVGRRVAAARDQIFDSVKASLQARLGVSTESLHSLIDAIRSRIDLSIQTHLRPFDDSKGR
jgi:RNA polymerase sigma-70 factor (ECF subfamily)